MVTVANSNDVPHHFVCPLTLDVMEDPVMTRDNKNFERAAIEDWIVRRGKAHCPLTREPLRPSDLFPNRALQLQIQTWKLLSGQAVTGIGKNTDQHEFVGIFSYNENEEEKDGDDEKEVEEQPTNKADKRRRRRRHLRDNSANHLDSSIRRNREKNNKKSDKKEKCGGPIHVFGRRAANSRSG